jgi:hypothetical protein
MSKRITAKVLQADIPTQNGNVYPREQLEKAMNEYLTKGQPLFVTSKMQLSQNINLADVDGQVNKMHINGDGTVVAEIEIFKDHLCDVSEMLHFNMGCIGKVRNDGDVKVVEDLTFHYVSVDSTSAIVYPDSHD